MDRITANLLQEFIDEQHLNHLATSSAFERFANFSILTKDYSETFDVDDISCGDGNDTGIDGLAILVNGHLVNTEEEVQDICEINGYLDATFIFSQAKTSTTFSTADIGTFCFGVQDFFSPKPGLVRSEFISRMARIMEEVYRLSAKMSHGNPICKLYYVTAGTWQYPLDLIARYESETMDLRYTGLFREITFFPIDAQAIQTLYRATKNKVVAAFTFTNKTLLPEMDGVKEAYLGVIPATEYLNLITDASGNIRRSLFYDNVRDFQDYNEVNNEIRGTLQSSKSNKFAILNNGVTVVTKTLRTVANRFHLEDYQIVNGCQTSHVLFDERNGLGPNVFVPIKIISTEDDGITNDVIKATNRQTQVRPEELNALSDFQKKLELYYATFTGKQQLHYERRSKQYNGIAGVEKVRIVTQASQIKAFASMFLDVPYRAGRYYGTILKDVGNRLFAEDHQAMPYYASAYALYRLEFLFRNALLEAQYKPFRYHLLMILRYQVGGKDMPGLTSRKIDEYSQELLSVLWDDSRSADAFRDAIRVVDVAGGTEGYRDTAKRQDFVDKIKHALSAGQAAEVHNFIDTE